MSCSDCCTQAISSEYYELDRSVMINMHGILRECFLFKLAGVGVRCFRMGPGKVFSKKGEGQNSFDLFRGNFFTLIWLYSHSNKGK